MGLEGMNPDSGFGIPEQVIWLLLLRSLLRTVYLLLKLGNSPTGLTTQVV